MSNAITTSNLSKRFGKTQAVDNLNLVVPSGSIFAFLGPNGAGKTSTIKTIMNILSATSGNATVLGTDSRRLGTKEFLHIGYVSENQALPEAMSVEQFLNYCQSLYPHWDKEFCQKLTKQFDLPKQQKLKNLSRGMKMKAALISALAYRPKLLVLDEPFSGLDPLVRDEFIQGIIDLTESQEWTIFISSHDIDEVERLADWVGFLNKGQLKITEKTELLQQRFKRVEITLQEPLDNIMFPKEWLFPEQDGRAVSFIDSQYDGGHSENDYKQQMPQLSHLDIKGMSMREIFMILARQFKMLSL